ncbi:MAG TPA: thiamine-phosphate kinase [Pyrinomonadaceae bacterium]|nr:thiamine-phosphate kinase [Pyrinomonadaceae bacterium]
MNEFDFIRKIKEQARLRGAASDLLCGIGDDAAVFKAAAGSNIVISADLLIEDVDFRLDSTTANLLGYKALAVSLSDIAAMGARPRWAMLSLGLHNAIWDSGFADGFHEGFFQLADRYGIKLIGGDVSRADKMVIDSIVIGECPARLAVLRSGAQPGDQIYVTGFLGDAAAGLRLLERGARLQAQVSPAPLSSSPLDQTSEAHPMDRLLLRQLKPEPRVGWGMLLGDQQLATAMIDLSDGLSSDLNHLCSESSVGALIDASQIPIDPLVRDVCGRRALDPLMLALHGGEDFELLFTVHAEDVGKLPKRVDGVALTRIGEITAASSGIQISEGARVWNLQPGGWEHFAR